MHAGIFRNYRLASDGQFTAKPRFEIHKLGSFTLINSQGSRLKEIYKYICARTVQIQRISSQARLCGEICSSEVSMLKGYLLQCSLMYTL